MDLNEEKEKLSEKFDETKEKASAAEKKAEENISKKFGEVKEKAKENTAQRKEKISAHREDVKEKLNDKKLNKEIERAENKLDYHVELANKKVDKVMAYADADINILLDEIDIELDDDSKPVNFVFFKAENVLAEILLGTEYELQVIKNELINNLEKDIARLNDLTSNDPKEEKYKQSIKDYLAGLDKKFSDKKADLEKKFYEK